MNNKCVEIGYKMMYTAKIKIDYYLFFSTNYLLPDEWDR